MKSRAIEDDHRRLPRRATGVSVLRVTASLPGSGVRRGLLVAGGVQLPCAIGRGGVTRRKREGDGGSPAGALRVIGGFFRADRQPRPRSAVPLRPLRRNDGWGDESGHPLYNRPLRRPARCGHEAMWRDDGLYDVVLVLDYNIQPRRAARGSAIFAHCAHPDLAPTAGCVALRPADMRRLLPRLARACRVVIR